MARYFFHLLGRSRWEDVDGEELPDVAAARACARRRIIGLGNRRGPDDCLSIQVTRADGRTLFTVSTGGRSVSAGTRRLR